ncbi:MAG: L,D-transpeptidase [Myxococcales bacterium]|nr:L,D-transpeptidase [Myxococcales bacterium]
MRSLASSRSVLLPLSLALLGALAGCRGAKKTAPEASEKEPATEGIVAAANNVALAEAPDDPSTFARADGPRLGAIAMALTIYEKPDRRSEKLGYLRLGATVPRGEKPARTDDCRGGYFNVLPKGYVCVDDGGTLDMQHPLVRAKLRRPHRDKPLPYAYAFVRAIAPRYYRLPSVAEQKKTEMALDRHIRSFERLKEKWNAIEVGANDVPLDEFGHALGRAPSSPPDITEHEKFGGDGDSAIPWFFQGGRQIPNVSSFEVPDYAVMTNRIARHAGVALIDAFDGDRRHFALTTDLRLIPTSKLKPGRGAVFHGVELDEKKGLHLPIAFVKREGGSAFYKPQAGGWTREADLGEHEAVQLTGEARGSGAKRYVEASDGEWLRASDLAIVARPSKLPSFASGGERWIDVSIQQQVLVLYEGKKPVYATMVSTGRDGLGDPKTTLSTPTGTFRVREKHVTTTMDSAIVGAKFELNDVPWVQYFKAGYALHAAYWHQSFGHARSHGCINLSPIDAFRIFNWSDPPVPADWHGANATDTLGEGTRVHIHP